MFEVGRLLPSLLVAFSILHAAPSSRAEFDILHYDIDVDVRSQEIVETVAIRARATSAAREWSLSLAEAMAVTSIESDGKAVPFEASGDSLTLDLSSASVSPGAPIEITVSARGRPHVQFSEDRGGFVRTQVSPEITHIRSQFPWYPRAEKDPATYRITVHAPEEWFVRTAGDESDPATDGERSTWIFSATRPIQEIGLVAGPYRKVRLPSPGRITFDALVFEKDRERAEVLLDVARRSFEHFDRRFGELEISRFSLVEMPESFGSGSGYGEEGYILVGQGAFEAGADAPWAISLVAHEVSHTWWGREVRFAHFASESLASWATLGFTEADRGAATARRDRRAAVERIVKAAAEGKEIALEEIRDWGAGMDPETYRAHAYEKGMMLLTMIEQAVGRESLDSVLAGLLQEHRRATIDYPTVREALRRLGNDSRRIVEQWENPGIPALSLDYETEASGKKYKLSGILAQDGTRKPFRMPVEVVAVCGDERIATTVDLTTREKKFRMTLSAEPDAVLVDPDYRLIAGRPPAEGAADAKAVIESGVQVANDVGVTDPQRLREAISSLTGALDGDPGEYEGVAYTGIGRCRFRLGEYEEAQAAFRKALPLGAGGPFHRAWIYLRLGNMADLRKDRAQAVEHYKMSIAQGERYAAAQKAAVFLERPYRGLEKDG